MKSDSDQIRVLSLLGVAQDAFVGTDLDSMGGTISYSLSLYSDDYIRYKTKRKSSGSTRGMMSAE